MGLLLLVATPATAGTLTPTSSESAALKALAAKIPKARLLWTRGGRVIHAAASTSFKPEVVTQGSITEGNPRWSPDGTQILTVRSDGVYVMKPDFTGATKVIPGGRVASWTRDGKSITCIDQTEYKALQYDLASKTTKTIYDAKQSPYNGQQIDQAAELRTGGRFLLVFRRDPTHVTEIVDLQLKKYISNTEMKRGDCSPAWAPDGSYILNTARLTSRPVLRAMFTVDSSGGSVSASKHLVGLDTGEKFYIHGQRVSDDGKWVAFGGKIFGGALQSALREIYIWPVGGADKDAVRVSFDTAEDEGPDLHVSPGTTPPPPADKPALTLDPTRLSLVAAKGGPAPSVETVAVANSGQGTLAAVTASITYVNGSGWLSVQEGGSGNSQTVENSVDIGGLEPDTYSATVKVSASDASNSPQSYTVSLTVTEKPTTDAGPPPALGDAGVGPAPDLGLTPPSGDAGSATTFSADERHLQGGCSAGGRAGRPGFLVLALMLLAARRRNLIGIRESRRRSRRRGANTPGARAR